VCDQQNQAMNNPGGKDGIVELRYCVGHQTSFSECGIDSVGEKREVAKWRWRWWEERREGL
jgi:hypothetical protein